MCGVCKWIDAETTKAVDESPPPNSPYSSSRPGKCVHIFGIDLPQFIWIAHIKKKTKNPERLGAFQKKELKKKENFVFFPRVFQ
jgi:hypothetical protein